jgi:hypothetical protein
MASTEKSRKSSYQKYLINAFIVFHLFVMVTMPVTGSIITRLTEKWTAPYANQIGLNANWNFFSPDPAHVMLQRIVVKFEDPDGNDLQEPIEIIYPPKETKSYVYNPAQRRFFYAMRYLMLDPSKINSVVGPYYCKQYSGSTAVFIEHKIIPIPPLQLAYQFDQGEGQEVKLFNTQHSCGSEPES